jgi:hypothetical protein
MVAAGNRWLVLHQPDLDTVFAALAAVGAPTTPEADGPAPQLGAVPARTGPSVPLLDARSQALGWALWGLALPVAVAALGGLFRARRHGT